MYYSFNIFRVCSMAVAAYYLATKLSWRMSFNFKVLSTSLKAWQLQTISD